MAPVPSIRVRALNNQRVQHDGDYVLYWMTAARRLTSNFALQYAATQAVALGKPLVVFEPIGCRARWSCVRFHAFVIEGMRDNTALARQAGIHYLPYVEPTPGAAKPVIESLAAHACVIVADDYPAYIVPQMNAALADRCRSSMIAVDGNGLWPMRLTDTVFPTAHSFRRFLQKNLAPHLEVRPDPQPLSGLRLSSLSADALSQLTHIAPPPSAELMALAPAALAALPIDQAVGKASFQGGPVAAQQTLQRFLQQRLHRYGEERNDPEHEAASGLSPYLHFGHIGAHEVFEAVIAQEAWSVSKLSKTTSGSREGWWGLSAAAESFFDELITWRELGFNMCTHREDYDQWSSLPDWAQRTLAEHAGDERTALYTPRQLEFSQTHDALWNAAQRQLVVEGRMHNYLRMLWGKKVLEWSATPQAALEVLLHLNNKYAVDGRDPNSYSGIFWIFGRYDRAWGPERPIFGKIRYMSSDNTARKLPVKGYLERYSAQRSLFSSLEK